MDITTSLPKLLVVLQTLQSASRVHLLKVDDNYRENFLMMHYHYNQLYAMPSNLVNHKFSEDDDCRNEKGKVPSD